jgi:D-alanine-D-alanine ligase
MSNDTTALHPSRPGNLSPRAAGEHPQTAAKRIAVLKGGGSLERKVSLRSGAQAHDALGRLGHDVVAIDAGADLVAQLREAELDAAFIALHGRDGEDGTVQGLLEAIGVPYTGSGPAACMRCTDKALAKHLMREAGLPTPDFQFFRESSFKELGAAAALPDVERGLGFPLVVKPASGGSALGVKFARSSEELPGAIVGALSYDRKILVERYVKGRDLAVSVLDDEVGPTAEPRAGEPVALPVVEAIPREEDFYNYESRYEIGMTTFVCPAELPAGLTARAQELALQTYRLLGCHGVARVDLMLDAQSDELTVLETNVVPGLTETSLLPLAADAAGIGFDELVGRILVSAWTR